MGLRLAAAFVLLLCAGGSGVAGVITGQEIVAAVNSKLSKEEQFQPLGWYLTKTLRLKREYHRLYPSGRLLWRQGVLGAVSMVCVLAAAALIGFGLIGIAWVGTVGVLSLWLIYFRKPSNSQVFRSSSSQDDKRSTSS